MADPIAAAYGAALKAKNELSALHEDFERGRNRSIAVQQRLTMMSQEFRKKVEQLGSLGRGDPRWDRRIQQLETDASQMEQLLNTQLGHMFQRRQEEEKREQLFGNRGNGEDVADLAQERKGIDESISSINELIDSGRSIITGIGHNNNLVKGAHKKALNVASALGVSDSLMHVISGREGQDRLLVCGCSCFTITLFFVLYYFVKM